MLPEAALTGHSRRILGTVLGVGVFGLAVLGELALLLHRRLVRPLSRLADATGRILNGDFQIALSVEADDELGHLTASFNGMACGLQERENLRRFVSSTLWQEAARQEVAAGRREAAVILFSDIRGFTTLSERHPADQVVQMLNEYFSAMDLVIRGEGGEIDKLIGDAIQAVFRPVPGADPPACRAVRAGLAMRDRLARQNGLRRSLGLFPIDNGIGIAAGEVLCGRIGPDQGRSDFSVMGPAVGEAGELEARSKAGRTSRVIVSATVRAALGSAFGLSPLADGHERPAQEEDLARRSAGRRLDLYRQALSLDHAGFLRERSRLLEAMEQRFGGSLADWPPGKVPEGMMDPALEGIGVAVFRRDGREFFQTDIPGMSMRNQEYLELVRRLARGLRTDIGVHFGPVIAGKIGSREGRIDLTVIGDPVNTAARLCSAAAAHGTGSSIFASGVVRERLPPDLRVGEAHDLALKGKTAPIRIHAVEPGPPTG